MFSAKNKNGCFDCDNCPENHEPLDTNGKQRRFCVMWWEYSQSNIQTGEQRTIKECGFRSLPVFLTEVVKASNRPAAAVESTRNEIAAGFQALTTIFKSELKSLS